MNSPEHKQKDPSNEAREALFWKRRALYRVAGIIAQFGEPQEEAGPGMPIVDSEGNVSVYSTEAPFANDLDRELDKLNHGRIDIASYADESGQEHVITLHAFDRAKDSGYVHSPSMVAVEMIIDKDGQKKLGSEPAVLVGKYDDDGKTVSSNELTKVFYDVFGNEDASLNYMRQLFNRDDADAEEYEAMKARLIDRLQQRYPERESMLRPATPEYWKQLGIEDTAQQRAEHDAAIARLDREEKQREERWKQKGKLGRVAARFTYHATSPKTRPDDIRDWR